MNDKLDSPATRRYPTLIGKQSIGRSLITALMLSTATGIALAQPVPVCEALTLYGNAVHTRLCRGLSPTTQNLWVCPLTDGSTDVHTTFNAATALHITVRTPAGVPECEGYSTLTGHWPAALAIAAGQPARICDVDIGNWVNRLNAVPRMPADGATLCRAPFLAAGAAGRISQATMQSYLNACNAQACP